MKRFAALVSAAAMLLSLTACGSSTAAMVTLEDNPPPLSAAAVPESGSFLPSPSGSGSSPSGASASPLVSDEALAACAKVLAAYPTKVPYPNGDDYLEADGSYDFNAYNEAWEAWQAVESERPSLPDDTDRLELFLRDSLRQFLSDGGEAEKIQLVYIGPSLTYEKLRTAQILSVWTPCAVRQTSFGTPCTQTTAPVPCFLAVPSG